MRNASLLAVLRQAFLAAVLVPGVGCTLKSQEAPDLTGPSEFAQSITVAASPDILPQDGSQSVITVTARGPNGEPLANLSMNAEIRVGLVRTEFGTLSARNIVTGPDGRGTFVYTAPLSPAFSIQESTTVTIAVTPIGTNSSNSSARVATIRVVPVGPVVPPDGLAPHFTFAPTDPQESQQVLFQACTDSGKPACAPANNPIDQYEWDFGDGHRGRGQFDTHSYDLAGSYAVTLKIVDYYGRSAATVQQITVGAGANPVSSFVFSPTDPKANQSVAFNASGSSAAAGRRIVSYTWDFGDGGGLQHGNPTMNHTYGAAGAYIVTLVVTDDAGKTNASTQTVTVVP